MKGLAILESSLASPAPSLRMTEEGSGETRALNLSQGQKSRPGQSNCNDGIM